MSKVTAFPQNPLVFPTPGSTSQRRDLTLTIPFNPPPYGLPLVSLGI